MKIHNYPYDPTVVDYDTTAVPFLSAQGHWRPGNSHVDPTTVPQMQSPGLAHTHMEVRATIYGEFTPADVQSVIVPVEVELFQVDGTVSDVYGQLIDQFTWDAGVPPVGDPNGVVTATGKVRVNLALADGSAATQYDVPKHGWFTVKFAVRTFYANGDRTDVAILVPFFSMIDPTQPETSFPQGGTMLQALCFPASHADNSPDAMGLWQAAQYDDYVPVLAPLTAAIPTLTPRLYGYGTAALPPGTGMTRLDMDLHHGSDGTLLQSQTNVSTDGVTLPSPFDPAIIGPGTHKIAALWQQDSGAGIPGGPGLLTVAPNEQATALLVLTITVGPVSPTAPTLTTVTPAQAFQGTTTPVTLTGTHFSDGATVAISGLGATVINLMVMGPTSLMASVVLDAMAMPGPRLVTVTTMNGMSNPQSFSVEAVPVAPVWSAVDGTFEQQVSPDPTVARFAPMGMPGMWTVYKKT